MTTATITDETETEEVRAIAWYKSDNLAVVEAGLEEFRASYPSSVELIGVDPNVLIQNADGSYYSRVKRVIKLIKEYMNLEVAYNDEASDNGVCVDYTSKPDTRRGGLYQMVLVTFGSAWEVNDQIRAAAAIQDMFQSQGLPAIVKVNHCVSVPIATGGYSGNQVTPAALTDLTLLMAELGRYFSTFVDTSFDDLGFTPAQLIAASNQVDERHSRLERLISFVDTTSVDWDSFVAHGELNKELYAPRWQTILDWVAAGRRDEFLTWNEPGCRWLITPEDSDLWASINADAEVAAKWLQQSFDAATAVAAAAEGINPQLLNNLIKVHRYGLYHKTPQERLEVILKTKNAFSPEELEIIADKRYYQPSAVQAYLNSDDAPEREEVFDWLKTGIEIERIDRWRAAGHTADSYLSWGDYLQRELLLKDIPDIKRMQREGINPTVDAGWRQLPRQLRHCRQEWIDAGIDADTVLGWIQYCNDHQLKSVYHLVLPRKMEEWANAYPNLTVEQRFTLADAFGTPTECVKYAQLVADFGLQTLLNAAVTE